MSDLKKRILLDLLAAPMTIVPFVLGVSFLLLGTVMGAKCGFFGFCLCLAGLGSIVTNFVFNKDNLIKKSLENIESEKRTLRDCNLNILANKLSPEGRKALKELRGLHDYFLDDVKDNKVNNTGNMLVQIEHIFDSCVVQIEKQNDLLIASREVAGTLHDGLVKQSKDMLAQVKASVKNLAEVIAEVRALGLKGSQEELGSLSDRLTRQLEVAKATDRELHNLDNDLSKFAEYQ